VSTALTRTYKSPRRGRADAAARRRGDQVARRRLLGGRDRVFEVENYRVGIERQRLLDPPRVIARREQETA
jgi:hypothetical protein